MHHVIADIAITPIGTGNVSVRDHIIAAEQVLQYYPDLKTQLQPMSTTLEGDLDTILQAVREMHEAPFKKGAQRVTTSIRIDDRHDGVQESMHERVESVKAGLSG